jgi:N-acetylmuramoyl-L-alanine amidase
MWRQMPARPFIWRSNNPGLAIGHSIAVVPGSRRSPPLVGALGALALALALSGCGGSAGAAASRGAATRPGATAGSPASSPPTARPLVRPPIHQWRIPYGPARRREMAAYSLRHYGEDTYLLSHPHVIVEHYTETTTVQQAFNTFAPDVPDSEFHELPNTCAHFLVEPSGRIDQLVSLTLRCRHATGLNWTAIGIEHVALSDQQVLDDSAQLRASLRLTRWLRCRYGITLRNVIGHNESLSSPFHRELVPAFAHQTHSDFNHADMHRYRVLLARDPCPGA